MNAARRVSAVGSAALVLTLAYLAYLFASTAFTSATADPAVSVSGRVAGPCDVLATGDLVVYDAAGGEEELATGVMGRAWPSTRTADGNCSVVFDVYPVPQREHYLVVVAGSWSATTDGAGGVVALRRSA
jgi:hypothetical protein